MFMASMDIVLPNLFVPGAAKSATTSLHEYLDQHPDIFMSRSKEPHFFSDEDRYQRGLESYSSLFEPGRNCRYRGESSTGYMVFPGTIERIKRHIPEAKFIFILRNPVDRAWSHYRWLQGLGFEDDDFRKAFLREMDDEPDARQLVGPGYQYYFQFGLYSKWLARYVEAFGRSAIYIVTAESLGRAPLETINGCLSFLGVSGLDHLEPVTKNKSVKLKYAGFYKAVVIAATSRSRAGRRPMLRSFASDRLRGQLGFRKRKFLAWLKDKLAVEYSDEPLSAELRRWVAAYYAGDIGNLRSITGIRFREWSSEFPFDDSEDM
jgi:hypothetical protein